VKLGSRLNIGYLEQEVHFENPNESVLDAYRRKFPMQEDRARTALARFLFFGNDVFKRLGDLSGGEKVRFQLCVLMKENPNLLLLDEPTNHLDINSQEVLQEAMSQYDGFILVVSHNRYFLDSFVNKVVAVKDGQVAVYEGNISDYLLKIQADSERTIGKAKSLQEEDETVEPEEKKGQLSKKEQRKQDAKRRHVAHHEIANGESARQRPMASKTIYAGNTFRPDRRQGHGICDRQG